MKLDVVNGKTPRRQARWLATALAVPVLTLLLLASANAAPSEE
jgi:hypothetical protein